MRVAAVVLGLAVALPALAYGYRGLFLLPEMRAPVLERLSDPGSAVFRNERYLGPWTATEGTLCGEVNAKNKMGGYVGYRQFASMYGDEAHIAEHQDDPVIPIYCTPPDIPLPWWWLRW